MRAYLIRRLILIIPTLFIVTVIVFLSVRFVPGSVLDLMVAEYSSTAAISDMTVEYLKEILGMNVPIYTQYFRWLGLAPQESGAFAGLFQGDFGISIWKQEPVLGQLLARLPITLELGIMALIIAWAIALPIGVFSAIRQDTLGDYAGRTFAIVCISVPAFWLGTMVVVYPSIWWGWTPAIVYIPFTEDVGKNLFQFIVPAVIMGMVMSGTTMRMTRTMMLEVLRQDYIRTAWSKGLKERTVIIRHAMKNALIPVVTIVGGMVPMIIGGTVVMEQIFCLPGVGRLMFDALTRRDYPVITGINVVLATTVLLMNVVVDITYAWLDPRIQYK
ncbi:ABC transporter permease [Chloroflexota bacterium]